MKKLILAGLLVVSAAGFAANGNYGHMQNHGRTRMEAQMASLTEDQKTQLETMRETHRKDTQELVFNIKEVNLKMQRELLNDKPNRVTLNKLIDEKSKYRVALEKKKMDYRLNVKEKFGIEMRGHHGRGHKGSSIGQKRI